MATKKTYNQIDEFYLAVNQLCKLLENTGTLSKRVYILSLLKMFGLVYLKSSLLDKPTYSETGEPEKFVTENDYNYIKEIITAKLGTSDRFIDIPIADEADLDAFESILLSESIADIYQDLKDFSLNFEIGNDDAIQASLNYCLDNFEQFWGTRMLVSMTALHKILFFREIEDEDSTTPSSSKSEPDAIDTHNWLINQRFNH